MTKLTDLVVFRDPNMAVRYANGKIPMTTLFEAYLDGDVDIPDIDAFLDARRDLVSYTLTKHHLEFFVTRFIPEVTIHSKEQDKRIVREHYDRGDDFFEAFLGDRMVYTSAFFNDEHDSLEQ
ncbi:MAG: class I SAM-dependent methyltransferase, partial [Polyangiaceae bacterium]